MKNKKYKRKLSLRIKLLVGLLLAVVLIVCAITVSVARFYRIRMEDYYKKMAGEIANYFTQEISADVINKYYSTLEKDEAYDGIHRQMNHMLKECDMESLYIIVPDGENDYTFVFDATEYDSPDYFDLGSRDVYYGNAKEMLENVWNGGESVGSVSNSKEFGYLVSVARTIKDADGNPVAAIIADISVEMINDHIRSLVTGSVLIASLLAVITMVLYYIYTWKIVISPIRRLEKATSEFPFSEDENGNLQVTKERHRSGDEIGSLFKSVVEMEQSIVSFMTNLRTVTAERERIGAELNVATQIQSSYLPSIFPPYPDRKEFDIYAMMHPAKEVGGDFYDFFFIDDNHLCLVIADVSGKGVGAAMFMMISKTFINGHAHIDMSPAKILAEVNDRLCENNTAEMFVTVWLGVLDIRTGIITAANGGHEYPFIQKAGGEYELFKDKHGLALGAYPGVKYTEYEIQLNKGDAIFVYTDGVAEATNANNELFETGRALASLNSQPDANVETTIDNVKKGIDEFVQDAPQFDDITMMTLRYYGMED